jgi:hypothetical protein
MRCGRVRDRTLEGTKFKRLISCTAVVRLFGFPWLAQREARNDP